MILLLLLCLLLCQCNKATAGDWVQEAGISNFDHSFSGYFGVEILNTDNTGRLESLVTDIELLRKREEQTLDQMLNEEIFKANLASMTSTPWSTALAWKYHKYKNKDYRAAQKEVFAKKCAVRIRSA